MGLPFLFKKRDTNLNLGDDDETRKFSSFWIFEFKLHALGIYCYWDGGDKLLAFHTWSSITANYNLFV